GIEMKMNKKSALIAIVLLSLTALLFTGCNFGKDDFYGTWRSGVFARPSDGKEIRVTFYFCGKSENLTTGKTAYFYEYYENLTRHWNTFWWGAYDLGNNADITNGTLTLRYMYGVCDDGTNPYTLQELIDFSDTDRSDAIAEFEGEIKSHCAANHISFTDQWDETNGKCSDVEKFSFKLDGAVAFQGYTQMVCTAREMYCEDGVQNISEHAAAAGTRASPAAGTSWGAQGASRSFSLVSNNGFQFGQDFANASTNIVSGTLPELNLTAPAYNEVALTPEK
ncbi:MAG: hypothetical protein IIT68_08925, partial [Treponema sp.]|nr:hypothetical protein [Treponema sp.]